MVLSVWLFRLRSREMDCSRVYRIWMRSTLAFDHHALHIPWWCVWTGLIEFGIRESIAGTAASELGGRCSRVPSSRLFARVQRSHRGNFECIAKQRIFASRRSRLPRWLQQKKTKTGSMLSDTETITIRGNAMHQWWLEHLDPRCWFSQFLFADGADETISIFPTIIWGVFGVFGVSVWRYFHCRFGAPLCSTAINGEIKMYR